MFASNKDRVLYGCVTTEGWHVHEHRRFDCCLRRNSAAERSHLRKHASVYESCDHWCVSTDVISAVSPWGVDPPPTEHRVSGCFECMHACNAAPTVWLACAHWWAA
jgi:hypothetical protein